MKVAYVTLGCKVNQYETEVLKELFENKGFAPIKKGEEPQIFVLNSCTVTAQSDRKTRQTLRHWKKKYPNCITVLLGCMPQFSPSEAEKIKEADIIFGNTDHSKIPELLEEFLKNRKQIIRIEEHIKGEKFKTPSVADFSERTRAYMKIEDGCDRFCSYCAIPYARGRVRSKPLCAIVKEAENLSENGYKEIVLVGINLSAYGKDGKENICDVVEAIAEIDNIKRIRLGSLEPDHITDEMLYRLKNIDKFCDQFHLSMQSGCDETLKRMNRHYDSAFYYDLVCRIRKIFKTPSITTDIMVGFAGETEEEFNKSLKFAKKVGFARSHVFAYSIRKGTAAAKLTNQLTGDIKQLRSEKMIEAMNECEKEFLNSMVGLEQEVLFETLKDGYIEGYTPNYTRVRINTKENLEGEIQKVKLIKVIDDCIMGELL